VASCWWWQWRWWQNDAADDFTPHETAHEDPIGEIENDISSSNDPAEVVGPAIPRAVACRMVCAWSLNGR
jgi:hypothetical protein